MQTSVIYVVFYGALVIAPAFCFFTHSPLEDTAESYYTLQNGNSPLLYRNFQSQFVVQNTVDFDGPLCITDGTPTLHVRRLQRIEIMVMGKTPLR